MPAREAPERPDWLVPGANVLCYNYGRNPSPVATTVAKVATQSFTVTAEREPRYRIRGCFARMGEIMPWTRYVVPLDSVEAGQVLAAEDRAKRMSRARTAVDNWIRKPDDDNRRIAIMALQTLEND